MKTRRIGHREVSAIGLGGMPMSIEGRPDRDRSVATIHAALDAGVTLFDTADAYHLHAGEVGHNETLVAEAIASWGGDASAVLIATKGGHLRPGDGSWTRDGRPEHLKRAAEASLRRLGGIRSAASLGDRFAPFQAVATARGVSPQVVCLAWHLSTSARVIPIPGASRPETIRDSALAADFTLSAEESAALDAV